MAQIGPILPPGWSAENSDDALEEEKLPIIDEKTANNGDEVEVAVEDEEEDDGMYGPALPPDFVNDEKISQSTDVVDDSDEIIGPSIPGSSADDDDFDTRAKNFRQRKMLEEELNNRKRRREEWMTELPSNFLKKSCGLTARTFKKHSAESPSQDRSVWTDTPEDRFLKRTGQLPDKLDTKEEMKKKAAADRDKKFDEQLSKLNEKRQTSLFDEHTKQRKTEEPKGPKERVPFDRDRDLGTVNLRSSTDRKKMIDNAKHLDSRFRHGHEQKYI